MLSAAIRHHLRPLLFVFSRLAFVFCDLCFFIYHLFTKRVYVTKPTDDLLQISATQAAAMIINREITSEALVEAYIQRIEQVNPVIRAVVVENFADARKRAKEADSVLDGLRQDGDEIKELSSAKPLLGVPFTQKDCIALSDLPITCGIKAREGKVVGEDADVIQRMRNAGAILLAVTNVPEVCMWFESVNTVYGRSYNPYDTRRNVGGSSGGEGALLGAAGSLIGVGSDIGGSIRMPSFFNGIFGMKPSPGVVSLKGHLPMACGYREQMLRIGPMCRYADDLTLMLKVMAGSEEATRLRLSEPVSLKKARVFYMEGVNHPLCEPLSAEQRHALVRAVRYFEKKYDLVAVRVDLPLAQMTAEMWFASMDDAKDQPTMSQLLTDMQGEVNCLTEIGKLAIGQSNHTLPALVVGLFEKYFPLNDRQKKEFLYMRDRLIRQIKELLGSDGILLFPSFPVTAHYHNEPLVKMFDIMYTCLWNVVAVPVVACPMGLSKKTGMPTGVQVIGAPMQDRMLIAAAKDLEEGFGGWTPAAPI